MNKISWYYKQSVAYADMRYQGDSADTSIKNAIKESEQPFGVVSGYEVTPGSGLNLTIGTTTSVAYDRQGRRMVPTAIPLTQSIAATTAGGSTAVSTGGNERWVSVFAKYGRKYSDAATDGSSNAVRKTVTECINSLGDSSHPDGAYDATVCKEAGVDKFYITVGAELPIGTAVRPILETEGVLIVDVHLVNGQGTIATGDLFFDRRQKLIPMGARLGMLDADLYAQAASSAQSGLLADHGVYTSETDLTLQVDGVRGFVLDPVNTGGLEGRDYRYFEQGYGTTPIKVPPPDASLPRLDLVYMTHEGEVRVTPGTAATVPIRPLTPSFTVPLSVVKAMPGTTNTSTWPIVRASSKRLPFPWSEMTGIISGCRLKWVWKAADLNASPAVYAENADNLLVMNGQSVRFTGGLDTAATPVPYFPAQQDGFLNPFASASPSNKAYYIYACRKQFATSATTVLFKPSTDVLLVESLTAPDANGRPALALVGPSGESIAIQDSLVIGVGWVVANTVSRMPVQQSGNWFTPLVESTPNWTPVGAFNPLATHTLILPGAPQAIVTNVRCRLRFKSPDGIWDQGKLYVGYGAGHSYLQATIIEPTGQVINVNVGAGEYTFATDGGVVKIYADRVGWEILPVAYEARLPRAVES